MTGSPSDDGPDAEASPDEATDGDVGDPQRDDGFGRRRLIRILVGLGIGIPVLIELRTFLSLVLPWVGADDGGDAASETPPGDAVGVGDELLPETEPVERLRSAEVSASGDAWPFTVVVDVENAGDVPYGLHLGAVTTRDGTAVEGGAGTDRLPPGESTTLATTWSLPEGATPRSMAVRAEVFSAETPEVIDREVVLAGVPVEG